jgi:hypothetical protein
MYFIKLALEFCKDRIKLSSTHSRQAEYVSLSAAIALHHTYILEETMMHIATHSQQEKLICTLTQQGSLVVVHVVLSFFMLSLLIYAFFV